MNKSEILYFVIGGIIQMADIKLTEKNTHLAKLKMPKMPWDVEVRGDPYQVVRIEGYVHSIGGKWGENNLWMYPRNCNPTYETLIEYHCEGCGVCWGIVYNPHNYTRTKWDETECFTSNGAMITRNDKDFYFCSGGIDEAKWLIKNLEDHPLELNEYDFDKKMLGRKVWWRSEPAIITRWIGMGQACVILEPDGIDKFTKPKEFANDDYMDDDETYIKADIFDKHIWWFRE